MVIVQAWEHTNVESGAIGCEIMAKYVKFCLNEKKMELSDISLDFFLNSYILDACSKSPNLKFSYECNLVLTQVIVVSN